MIHVNTGELERAIGMGVGIKVVEEEDTKLVTIEAGFKLSTKMNLDPFILSRKGFPDEHLWGVVAQQLRRQLQVHLFTILENCESPELDRVKRVAHREGWLNKLDHNPWA